MSEEKHHIGGMLIFCVVFLGSFIALLAAVPSQFYVDESGYEQYQYPSYFTMEDVEHIKFFKNETIIKGSKFNYYDFTAEIDFIFFVHWYSSPNQIEIFHVTWKWWIFQTAHRLDIEDLGEAITKEEALTKWNPELNTSVFYPASCNHITVKIWITDSNTSRNDLSQAWDDGEIQIGIGFGIDDYATKLNIWSVIGRLLTFQTPSIYGLTGISATIIKLLIGLPLWTCIVYLIYRLILMAIPFVGG